MKELTKHYHVIIGLQFILIVALGYALISERKGRLGRELTNFRDGATQGCKRLSEKLVEDGLLQWKEIECEVCGVDLTGVLCHGHEWEELEQ